MADHPAQVSPLEGRGPNLRDQAAGWRDPKADHPLQGNLEWRRDLRGRAPAAAWVDLMVSGRATHRQTVLKANLSVRLPKNRHSSPPRNNDRAGARLNQAGARKATMRQAV
jgi:hypothetical protein